MKAAVSLVAEILALRSDGQTLTIECRSGLVDVGDSMTRLSFALEVPDTFDARAEYQIGSEVVVTVEPKR